MENPLIDKIRCQKSRCKGQLTVPIKLVVKGPSIVDVCRCPSCHKDYKLYFNPSQEDDVIELFKDSFYFCDVCGADNKGNFVEGETWEMDRRKIVMRCSSCGKKRAKVATEKLLNKIEKFDESPKAEAPQTQVEQQSTFDPSEGRQCPACGTIVDPDYLFCTECGQILLCDRCRKEVKMGSKFCQFCGGEIEKSN